MRMHKFSIGDTLEFRPTAYDREARQGYYKVVRLLPAESLGPQYRVQSVSDGHERVVAEGQLLRRS